ncbi:MAG TPA: hypothetical protein PKX92_03280 [Edaphocola sp.]|nr:hypothetical protein [Edaphocola sp.]
MNNPDATPIQNKNLLLQSIGKGMIFILVGAALLLKQIPATQDLLPEWLYGIHSLMIAFGLYLGIQKNFNGVGWLILIIIGILIALSNYDIMNTKTIFTYGVPFGLIIIGLFIITKRN